MTELTAFDKSLLNLLQGNLPVCPRPFAALAEELGTTEDVVLNRLRELKEADYLRRIGTFFDSTALGYRGTLVALEVEADQLPAVAEVINHYSNITHNYEREGQYNLWFTLMSPDEATEKSVLSAIRELPGVKHMLNLKANKKYKINVKLRLG